MLGPWEEGVLFGVILEFRDHFEEERLLLGSSDPSELPVSEAKQTGP